MQTMFGRLGFVAPGPEMLVVDQDINWIEEFSDLDDAKVDALLKLLCRPGGIISNPNTTVAGQTSNITTPGISVSMRAVTHLKLSVYYCRDQMRTSHSLRTTDIALSRIKTLKNLREEEESAIGPLLPPKVDVKNWSKTLEAIQEWISMYQGIKKSPFLRHPNYYRFPDYATDPAYLDPDSEYSSYQKKITARSPIHHHLPATFAANYTVDNKAVCELIASVCRDEDCWTHVKPFSKKKDGRNAFLALWDYCLGI